ncbi:MAG: sulfocyanin-like copper-binding protein [Candidatus Dormibacteria bacterium]
MAALVALTALAGCGAVANPTPDASAPATTSDGSKISLTEFKITGAAATYPVGKTDVTITNNGGVDHELLVFKSDLTADKYPVDDNGKINEEGAGINKVSDGDNVAAGKSQTRTLDLTAGTYLFVCNLPGHFKSGMYSVVTVK